MNKHVKLGLIIFGALVIGAAYASKIPLVGLVSTKLPSNDWLNGDGSLSAGAPTGIMG